MDISISQYAISMLLYIAVLFLIIELMRKYHRFALIFWLLSLLTFPLWPAQLEGWFRWAKTFSVLIPTAIFVGFGRLANYEDLKGKLATFKKDWVLWVLYGVLFLNIAEATLKDFATSNYFNGFVGIVLCITIPLLRNSKTKKQNWLFSKDKPGDLLVYTSPLWNFLYTTWNLVFVYGENPGFFASSFCILMAAELYPVIKKRPELYVTARIYTLAFHILIRSTYDIFTPVMNSTSWFSGSVLYYWGLINFLIAIPFIINWVIQIKNNKQ